MKNLNLGAIFDTRKFLALMAIVTTVIAIPNTASARGSVHIDIPGISIGLHDRHGYRNNHRGYRNNHHGYRNYRHGYRNNRHGYRHHKRHRRHHYRSHRRNHDNYYTNNNYYYNDSYTNGYRNYRPRTDRYRPRYSGEICPIPGFSTGYDDDRGCYAHKDHFHCDT